MTNETKQPSVGLHQEMGEVEYHAIDAANFSRLAEFDKSAAHVYEYLINPQPPTKPMSLGTAVHHAILHPDTFDSSYVEGPEGDMRTTTMKAKWAQVREGHPEKTIIRGKEWKHCLTMRDTVWKHPYAAALLKDGLSEVPYFWEDPQTGLFCKARFDHLGTSPDGWPTLVDVKSIVEATEHVIQQHIARYAYHCQGAHYGNGLNVLAPAERRFVLLFVESSPPYSVRTVEPGFATMELGRRKVAGWLKQYDECLKTDRWPGYSTGLDTVDVPEWVFRQEEIEEPEL